MEEENKIIKKEDFYCRTCDECKKGMNEGYCIGGGQEYYCTDECLHKKYTPDELKNIYDDTNKDFECNGNYWTEWDIDEEYECYLDENLNETKCSKNDFEIYGNKSSHLINNKNIRLIEKHIYSCAYDDLSNYGKGIRDLLNYLNSREEIEQKDIVVAEIESKRHEEWIKIE